VVSSSTAIAKEPTVVIRLSRNLFRKTLEGYPAAAEKLRDILAARLAAWNKDLASVRRKLDK
jgi:CRP-like cAMP-binding protein